MHVPVERVLFHVLFFWLCTLVGQKMCVTVAEHFFYICSVPAFLCFRLWLSCSITGGFNESLKAVLCVCLLWLCGFDWINVYVIVVENISRLGNCSSYDGETDKYQLGYNHSNNIKLTVYTLVPSVENLLQYVTYHMYGFQNITQQNVRRILTWPNERNVTTLRSSFIDGRLMEDRRGSRWVDQG